MSEFYMGPNVNHPKEGTALRRDVRAPRLDFRNNERKSQLERGIR